MMGVDIHLMEFHLKLTRVHKRGKCKMHNVVITAAVRSPIGTFGER